MWKRLHGTRKPETDAKSVHSNPMTAFNSNKHEQDPRIRLRILRWTFIYIILFRLFSDFTIGTFICIYQFFPGWPSIADSVSLVQILAMRGPAYLDKAGGISRPYICPKFCSSSSVGPWSSFTREKPSCIFPLCRSTLGFHFLMC